MTKQPRLGRNRQQWWARAAATLAAGLIMILASVPTAAAGVVGTSLPPDFPVIIDSSLGVPVIGFGAAVFEWITAGGIGVGLHLWALGIVAHARKSAPVLIGIQ